MAQRYIPEIVKGDKRILLIGGEPVPYCLARIPLAGETRGNLAAGGRGVAQPLSPRDREIAEAVAPKLAARGLLLVGLDVIGDYVTEVNVTSPTCFVEIAEQTGFDVAGMFAQALESSGLRPRDCCHDHGYCYRRPRAARRRDAGLRQPRDGQPDGMLAIHDIQPEDLPDDLAPAVLKDILDQELGGGVLVLTDLIGATPANIAKRAVADAQAQGIQCCVLAGLNTPMLLRALTLSQPAAGRDAREKALAGSAGRLACRLTAKNMPYHSGVIFQPARGGHSAATDTDTGQPQTPRSLCPIPISSSATSWACMPGRPPN